MKLKPFLTNLFTWQPEQIYHFSLPENSSSNSNENYQTFEELASVKDIFPSSDVNLDYIKTRFNTLINSDIVIREFIVSARNRQFKAFLLFIDGMVDSKFINDFVLKPLMMKNEANSFEGDQSRIISEAVTNNITVRRVKKFDVVDYIFNCLLPQNNVKQNKDFNSLIQNVNSRKLCSFCRYFRLCF